MKYFIIFLIAAAVIGGGTIFAVSKYKEANQNGASAYQTDKVTRRLIEKIVSANGKIASNRDVDIKCQASGAISKLPYTDVNMEVKPGELVCELDPKDEEPLEITAQAVVDADQARLEEAKQALEVAKMALVTTKQRDDATLASSQSKADQTKAKAERTKQLFDSKLASQEDLDTDQADAASAVADLLNAQAAIAELDQQKIQVDTKEQQIKEMDAALQQDQSRLTTAKQNVEYCKVFAPDADDPNDPPRWFISALLTNIAKGYIVQSGTSGFSAGTTIMTLSDLSHIYCLASVDESDVGEVMDAMKNGAKIPVRITADAYQGMEFKGVVVRVATKGVNTNNVVTFEVKIEVTDENRMLLRPEMTTTSKIIVASRPDVLTIPVGAFMKEQPEGSDNGNSHGNGTTAPADPPGAAPAATESAGTQPHRGRGGSGGSSSGHKHVNNTGVFGVMSGAVQVLPEGATEPETRNVVVGITDTDSYEIVRGDLKEGDTVIVHQQGSDSKWRGNGNSGLMPRGFTGGGRGR